MSASIQSCALCAACEPVCPEEIGLVEMTLDLRRRLPQHLPAPMFAQTARPAAPPAAAATVLLGCTAYGLWRRYRPVRPKNPATSQLAS